MFTIFKKTEQRKDPIIEEQKKYFKNLVQGTYVIFRNQRCIITWNKYAQFGDEEYFTDGKISLFSIDTHDNLDVNFLDIKLFTGDINEIEKKYFKARRHLNFGKMYFTIKSNGGSYDDGGGFWEM